MSLAFAFKNLKGATPTETYKGTVTGITVTAGTGLSSGGTVSASTGTKGGTITLKHYTPTTANTASTLGSAATGTTYAIKGIHIDGMGHAISVTTGSTTMVGSVVNAGTGVILYPLCHTTTASTAAAASKHAGFYFTNSNQTLSVPNLHITKTNTDGTPLQSLKIQKPEDIYFTGLGENLIDFVSNIATADGNDKVKSSTATSKVYLFGSTSTGTVTTQAYKHASVYMSAGTMTATAFYQNSDETLKDFHEDINVDFNKIKSIPKKYYTWKDGEDKSMQIGTSAQKLQEVYPELVNSNGETLTVDYARLSIVALKAVDKLYDENQKLQNLIEKMDKRITELEDKIK